MKIYWTLSSVPELASLPSRERKAVWRACYFRSFRMIRVWVALAGCALCAGLGGAWAESFGSGLVGALLGAALGGFIFGQTATRAALPEIRRAVARPNLCRG